MVDEIPSVDNNSSSAVVSDKFMAQVESLIYQKVNEERAKAGLAALSYNTTMEKYARIKSQDMGDNNYFSHEDLSGNLITTQMKNDGVTYRAWGENIAYIGGEGSILGREIRDGVQVGTRINTRKFKQISVLVSIQ